MNRVAKVIITDAENNALIVYRSVTHPSYAHQPDLPGGVIEAGEEAVTGLVRELHEEIGWVVQPEGFTLVATGQRGDYVSDSLYQLQLENIVKPSNITLSWEHERYEWIPLPTLLAQVLPNDTDSYYVFALDALRKTL